MGKLEASRVRRTAQVWPQRALIFRSSNLGNSEMSYRIKAIAAAVLSLATLAPAGLASAADLPYKAKAKPIADLPFFFVIDDRVTYSWMPKGTNPAPFTVRPAATTHAKTPESVYSCT